MKTTRLMNELDNGAMGKAVECALTGWSRVKASGRADWTHFGVKYEIKTGAGELGTKGHKLLKNSKYVIYIPIPVLNSEGLVDPELQEGWVLTREEFMEALEECDAIREKTSTAGVRKVTIQTFWNAKKQEFHGRLYDRMVPALDSHCIMTLEEFIQNGCRI